MFTVFTHFIMFIEARTIVREQKPHWKLSLKSRVKNPTKERHLSATSSSNNKLHLQHNTKSAQFL